MKVQTKDIIHGALVAFGALGLQYIWQVPLGQQMGYFNMPETMLPFFAFLTAGIVIWDMVLHKYILK